MLTISSVSEESHSNHFESELNRTSLLFWLRPYQVLGKNANECFVSAEKQLREFDGDGLFVDHNSLEPQ